jgi:hypothetical protein
MYAEAEAILKQTQSATSATTASSSRASSTPAQQ